MVHDMGIADPGETGHARTVKLAQPKSIKCTVTEIHRSPDDLAVPEKKLPRGGGSIEPTKKISSVSSQGRSTIFTRDLRPGVSET